MVNEISRQIAKPVTIISGFLGAGKTTFLNEFIAFCKNTRPFIIENEFGKESIDAGLILAPNADIFELNAGCLCCNLNEDFFDLLSVIWERKDEFDELIVETTGIADPATVAQPFFVSPVIERYYQLERVICLVDARHIQLELEETEEARKQIVFADIIVLNKCDLVDNDQIKELGTLLRNINPFATIFSGSRASGYPVKDIMALTRGDFDNRMQEQAEQTALTPASLHYSGVKEHHHRGISSLTFTFDIPFDLTTFEHRLLVFLNLQARDIYRVKGFIWTSGSDEKVVVQSVANLLGITPGAPWEQGEARKSRIVFIGRDLKSKGLKQMLDQCLDKRYSTIL